MPGMRKVFAILIVVLWSVQIALAGFGTAKTGRYAENSVLASDNWYKIRVSQTGVYKLTYEQLVRMGVDNPANVRIYGYGGAVLSEDFTKPYIDDLPEVKCYMEKGGDGVFGAGDYVLFFAQGPVSWAFNRTNMMFEHTLNTYSDYGYYFVTSGRGVSSGMEMSESLPVSGDREIRVFDDYYVHEEENVNLMNSGKKFFGEEFNSSNPSRSFSVNFPNMTTDSARFVLHVAHVAQTKANVSVDINGHNIGTLELAGRNGSTYDYAKDARGVFWFKPSGNNINVKLTYSNPAYKAYLNYFTVNVRRNLKKTNGKPLFFRYVDYEGVRGVYKFVIDNVFSDNVAVWDITDRTDVKAMPVGISGGKAEFASTISSVREYVALDVRSDEFPEPEFVGRIPNQNLHALGQVDMVIISHSEFVGEAMRLSKAHAAVDGLTVHVVTPDCVYNEFSSGTPDATAYRRFMKMFYDRASSEDNAPKYLLLFGDGSFDNRRILKKNTDKDIYRLLTYQSENSYSETSTYTTDDYFALLDDSDGKIISINEMDIAVGRIPAYTLAQATGVVDKIIRYMENDDFGEWKNLAIFLADDGDANDHVDSADSVCNLTQMMYPELLTRKLYFDSYKQEVSASGESYPSLKKEFMDYINSGVLMINYMGHGSYIGWANEQVLTMADIEGMYNKRLPLWITATCDFSRFDDFKDSGGEKLMMNPNGGAIALITTSRTVLARPNFLLSLELSKEILDMQRPGEVKSVGEALRRAKNKRAVSNDANRLSFVLLGDPAVRLNFPVTHNVVLESVNDVEIAEKHDTVGALDLVSLKGSVRYRSESGSEIDESFNGYVHVTVFDKEEQVRTLCNDAGSVPFKYRYRTNPLFSGKADVKDGRFEVRFILPKDIRYNFGRGRVVMYAVDPDQGIDGNGNSYDLIIGGENPDVEWENDGPQVNVYLNTPEFRNGGQVNENPLFVAHVSDRSGINTVGSGIGHDIILKLDNDPKYEYVLNKYYESSFGSYTDGYVHYQLSDLPEGKHSLYFRVWDLLNNSTSVELQFEVVKGLDVNVNNVMVYPNPASEYVVFAMDHDRPRQPVSVQLFVYDFAGRMVWRNSGNYVTDDSSRFEMQWDLKSSAGRGVCDGLYLVKMVMVDADGTKDSKTTKMLVHRQ